MKLAEKYLRITENADVKKALKSEFGVQGVKMFNALKKLKFDVDEFLKENQDKFDLFGTRKDIFNAIITDL